MEAFLIVSDISKGEYSGDIEGRMEDVLSVLEREGEKVVQIERTEIRGDYLRKIEIFGIGFLFLFRDGSLYFRPEGRYERTYRKMKGKVDMVEGFARKSFRRTGGFHLVKVAVKGNKAVRIAIKY